MGKTFNFRNLPIAWLFIGTVVNIVCFCFGWFTFNGWTAGAFYIGALFEQCLIGFVAHIPEKTAFSKQYSRALSLSYIVLGCVITCAVFAAYNSGDEPSNVIISQQADFALLTWLLLGFSVSVCRLLLIASVRQDKNRDRKKK